ncbi:MAG: 50S ribosomal protein L10 [Candidatus Bathyarchaeia archaeon]
MQRRVSPEKVEEVEEIKKLFSEYKVIGIAALHKVRASQLQEIRKKLEGTAYLRVIKNTLTKKSIADFQGKQNIEKMKEYLEGSNLFIFTNINPFKLALVLDKSKVKDFAKAKDIVMEDIIVPAGNTGLPPGPIISQLNSVGIPTRIDGGSVWVNRDTVVAKKGDVISESLAPVLSKLGIKPIEMGLNLKAVYDDGRIIPEKDLKLRPEEYKEYINQVLMQSMNLALNAAYPLPETMSILIQIANFEAHNLAINANALSPEILPELIRKAYAEASVLKSKIQM